ncbi:TIGR01244 family sulfur transferase [Rhizobiaceae bacterium n13]|uniref:TIGR01244 family sulfur transferase n=1 Tax=Ferirhizobium litorale TaxID=2927786 RepID=A0AAE3U560_9HYPH|nr:TIGR01244 family sulfur transferase [Fererhizobium litorale]MDI7863752.1 TIGR01244 family sulfur transferase [Fererhizobium litorale]MDI7924148.1 TIGR01244 family sulfur transferase [Fererhizobium litorale]
MDIRQINDEYSVSGQITVEDLDQIKALGFQSIVCHRPDHESPDQPLFADIAKRAEELGLSITHIPVGPMGVTADAVTQMVDALDEFPRPMLGYCRSGARSTAVYQQTLHIRA